MSYVKVDLDGLTKIKNSIVKFNELQKDIVTKMNTEVENLAEGWSSKDKTAFENQWNLTMNTPEGKFPMAKNEFDYYKVLLEKIISEYKNAQQKAIDESVKLDNFR